MAKLRRCVTPLALLQALLLLGWSLAAAQEAMPGKGDSDSPPGRVEWTLVNRCDETIDVALHYAPEASVVTAGWWVLAPGESVTLLSASEHLGWYAKSASHHWSGRDDRLPLAVDHRRRFEFEGFDPPAGLTPTRFRSLRAERSARTEITCPR